MDVVAFDTETYLIGDANVFPRPVCLSLATRDTAGVLQSQVIVGDDAIEQTIRGVLTTARKIVGHQTDYDAMVLCRAFPDLIPDFFAAYYARKVEDTKIREKLGNLSTHGQLTVQLDERGRPMGNLLYSLATLEKKYLGVDRSALKKAQGGEPDPWRLRYSELDGVPLEEWPQEAVTYAEDDAIGTLLVYEEQENNRTEVGPRSMNTSEHQAYSGFALAWMTHFGMRTDPVRVRMLEEGLEDLLSLENMAPLIEAKILKAPQPPRPHKTQKGKMVAGKPSSVTKIEVQERILWTARELGVVPILTDKAVELRIDPKDEDLNPKYVSTSGAMIEKLEGADEVLDLYIQREGLIKIRSTFLPALKSESGRTHFPFEALVSTGRSSSYRNKLFPSCNGQNLPRLGGDLSVRECFIADADCYLLAVDYSSLELCSVAQATFDLFGSSKMRDKLLAGYDLHAYLGSVLARNLDDGFRDACSGMSEDEAYEAFIALKRSEDADDRKRFKHYRTFAKPTGLGYPGGLGPATFVEFAKSGYGVEVDLELAKTLRELWFETYPEMRHYFAHVNRQKDPVNSVLHVDPETGEETWRSKYRYTTPMGMVRAGCYFTEAANGIAMQSPSAEGAKLAVQKIVRECVDWSVGSDLYGCRPVNFIHDEVILNVPRHRITAAAARVSAIMIEEMGKILPDVPISVEASAMDRWYKEAEPVRGPDGELLPWAPEA